MLRRQEVSQNLTLTSKLGPSLWERDGLQALKYLVLFSFSKSRAWPSFFVPLLFPEVRHTKEF
jgi:hypothetical protein